MTTSTEKIGKNCLNCGFPVSMYYFTDTKDVHGKIYRKKCPNCGLFEDPE